MGKSLWRMEFRWLGRFSLMHLCIYTQILCIVDAFYPLDPTLSEECKSLSLSCSSNPSTDTNTCCVNSPGGHFLLTQFWDTAPSIGANDSWTIHGLWPDHCQGGFDQFCDHSRELSPAEIIAIVSKASEDDYLHANTDDDNSPLNPYKGLLTFMQENWLAWDGHDANLWAHEWNKHGTCVSTLEPRCYSNHHRPEIGEEPRKFQPESKATAAVHQDLLDYFTHTAHLYSTLDTFTALTSASIVPSHSDTYTLAQLQEAIQASTHGFPVTFKCHGAHHDELTEIWYHFNVLGSLKDAGETWANLPGSSFFATAPEGNQRDNCPQEGIRWLPKEGKDEKPKPIPQPPATTTTTTASSTSSGKPTGTTNPFEGRGRLMVKIISEETGKDDLDEFSGCLIRSGEWYGAKSPTSCAIFRAGDDVSKEPTHEHILRHQHGQTILGNNVEHETDEDNDSHYHLFTLESSRAPCSFVQTNSASLAPSNKLHTSQPGAGGYLSCERKLTYQSIFNAHKAGKKDDERDGEPGKRSEILAWSQKHQTTFYAARVPKNFEKVKIWNADDAQGENSIKVEVHWAAL